MLIVENDLLLVRIACLTVDQAAVNTRYYAATDQVGAGIQDTVLAEEIDEVMAPLYKALLSEDAEYYGVSVQRIFPLPKLLAAVHIGDRGPGTEESEILPTQVSGIITLQTQNAGPSGRGRVYIPFPGEGSSIEGVPSEAYMTALTNLGGALAGTVVVSQGGNGITLRPLIWHRETATGSAVLGFRPNRAWATQRRRGSYGQKNRPPF